MVPDLNKVVRGGPLFPEHDGVSIEQDGKRGFGYLDADETVYAVGWLGDHVTSIGEVSASCIDKLFLAYEQNLVFSDQTDGSHVCEICLGHEPFCLERHVEPIVAWKGRELALWGHGHYLIRYEQAVYMAPALLLHYILDHQYKPPDQFVKAVIEGRFLTADDLVFRPSWYSPGSRVVRPRSGIRPSRIRRSSREDLSADLRRQIEEDDWLED